MHPTPPGIPRLLARIFHSFRREAQREPSSGKEGADFDGGLCEYTLPTVKIKPDAANAWLPQPAAGNFEKFGLTLAFFLLTTAHATELFDETRAQTLFAFDDQAIPHSQNLRLEMIAPQKHPANPVVNRGKPGSSDALGVQFYGSILKENDRYRLWYVAFDDESTNRVASSRWRAAYAESTDGIHWTKPNLGLVQHRGNKNNNLLNLDGQSWGIINLKVLRDDSDPDPTRRYKMTTHVYFQHNTRLGTLLPFTSPDGLNWKPVANVTPVKAQLPKKDLLLPGVHFEPCGGFYRWQGQFIINGQNAMPGTHTYQGRICRSYRSADFNTWSTTSTIAFVRTPQNHYLGPGRSREGPQNHEGISVWHRNNVLLGITGRWQGAADWKDIRIDLGLVLSNNGLHFREPKHEWTFLHHGTDGQWDEGGLLQGQGFENIGQQTFIYYGSWDPRGTGGTPRPRGGIGIATLERDRFAALRVDPTTQGPGDYQLPVTTAECITQTLETKDQTLHLNISGLTPENHLQLELLDALERPLPDFSGTNASRIQQNGFQVPVTWKTNAPLPEQARIRILFDGPQRETLRLHALYLTPKAPPQ